MTDRTQRRVVCAAVKGGDIIVVGPRHFDDTMHMMISRFRKLTQREMFQGEQGFIDQWGKFMSREEALAVAIAAGQLRGEKNQPTHLLFSEDLY